MNILLLGGTGFIGSRVANLLRERGHTVTLAQRSQINLLNLNEEQAKSCLQNQDVVVNMVGVMSRHADVLETVHHHAPVQLAQWAVAMGVKHWVQLSALGADAGHEVAFVGSKGRGDKALLELGHLTVNVARPSVVFGRGGKSCEMFVNMAKLPVLVLPSVATGLMQPVHVDDVALGLVKLAEQPLANGAVVNMVGATRHTLAEYLRLLRETIHGKRGLAVLPMPMMLIQPFLPLGNVVSNGFLSKGSMKLLQEGAWAESGDFVKLLGREPLGVREFVWS